MSRSSFTVMVVETFHSEQQTSVSRKSERVSQQTSSSGNHECLFKKMFSWQSIKLLVWRKDGVWTEQPILDPQRFYIWKTIFHFMVLNRLERNFSLEIQLIYTLIDRSLSLWYSTMVAATYALLQLHHSSFLFAKNLDFFLASVTAKMAASGDPKSRLQNLLDYLGHHRCYIHVFYSLCFKHN